MVNLVIADPDTLDRIADRHPSAPHGLRWPAAPGVGG